jgi:hypothetical protein
VSKGRGRPTRASYKGNTAELTVCPPWSYSAPCYYVKGERVGGVSIISLRARARFKKSTIPSFPIHFIPSSRQDENALLEGSGSRWDPHVRENRHPSSAGTIEI